MDVTNHIFHLFHKRDESQALSRSTAVCIMQLQVRRDKKKGREEIDERVLEEEIKRALESLKKVGVSVSIDEELSREYSKPDIPALMGDDYVSLFVRKKDVQRIGEIFDFPRNPEKFGDFNQDEAKLLKVGYIGILKGEKYHSLIHKYIPEDRFKVYVCKEKPAFVIIPERIDYVIVCSSLAFPRKEIERIHGGNEIAERLVKNRVKPRDLINFYKERGLDWLARALEENPLLKDFGDEIEGIIDRAVGSMLSTAKIERFPLKNPVVVVKLTPLVDIWATTKSPEAVVDGLKKAGYSVSTQYDVLRDVEIRERGGYKDRFIVGEKLTIPIPRGTRGKIPKKLLREGIKIAEMEITPASESIRDKRRKAYMIYNGNRGIGILWTKKIPD